MQPLSVGLGLGEIFFQAPQQGWTS